MQAGSVAIAIMNHFMTPCNLMVCSTHTCTLNCVNYAGTVHLHWSLIIICYGYTGGVPRKAALAHVQYLDMRHVYLCFGVWL